jgi:hypothetical protein
VSKVLGLIWNKERDTLSCDNSDISQYVIQEKITKRVILLSVNQIFDLIGFTCSAVLLPKLILQKTWIAKLSWDEELPNDFATKFTARAQEAFS